MRISDWSSDVCSSDLIRLVDLGDRDDHRCVGGLGMLDRFARLRHHAVIGRNDDDDDIGDLRATRTHARARRMAWRVEEGDDARSEEHTSELQSLMRISYAVFCLKTKKQKTPTT